MKRSEEKLAAIQEHADKCGLTVSALLLKAGVYHHYVARWKTRGGGGPSKAIMHRIMAVEPEGGT